MRTGKTLGTSSNKTTMGQTLSALHLILVHFVPEHFFSNFTAATVDVDQTGRTFLITGSNTGLGLATAIHFARLNAAHIILAVRDLEKGARAKDRIIEETKFKGVIDVWELDMAKFDSVKSFAEKAKSTLTRLDGAILNAGIVATPPWQKTSDGWERVLQVNGIATGLLAVLLLPLLQATTKLPPPHADASQTSPHLTIVGSSAQFITKFNEKNATNTLTALNETAKPDKTERYGVTKVFNLFLAREIAMLPQATGVVVNVVNPGMCASDIFRDRKLGPVLRYFYQKVSWTASRGALNLVYAAVAPTPPGAYITACEVRRPPGPAWCLGEAGLQIQRKVWDEMMEVWRGVAPEVDEIVQR